MDPQHYWNQGGTIHSDDDDDDDDDNDKDDDDANNDNDDDYHDVYSKQRFL